MQTEDDLIDSPLQQIYTEGVHSVDVLIYQLPQTPWTLEVVDMFGNSTVWHDEFATDQAALDEFFRTIQEEGIESMIGEASNLIHDLPPELATNLLHLRTPLSTEELLELDSFLISDATSEETMALNALDGYLTAFAIGPSNLHMNQWYPGIWGGREEDAPAFETLDDAQWIMELIMRHFNSIIWSIQGDPDTHEPCFGHFYAESDSREYVDGEMWAYGFMQGLAICREDWQPLFDDPDGPAWLNSIRLLVGDDLSEEEMVLVRTPSQRERLTLQIPAAIAAIFRFWLPYRTAIFELELAKTYQKQHPIIGSDDPCPCGSGEMFKQCCGMASTKH